MLQKPFADPVSAFHTPGHYTQKPGIVTRVFGEHAQVPGHDFRKKMLKFASFHSRPNGKIQTPNEELKSKKKFCNCNFKR